MINCGLSSAAIFLVLIVLDRSRFEATEVALSRQLNNHRHHHHEHHMNEHDQVPVNGLALTGKQWAETWSCKLGAAKEKNKQKAFKWPLGDLWYKISNKCDRDPNAWRYKYCEEFKSPFNHLVKDKSVDERLANLLYLVTLDNLFDISFLAFNSGDPIKDAENELRVAGSQVDQTRCIEELAIMSASYDNMLDTLARLRAMNETTARVNSSIKRQHIQLARVLDSFGRYESGSLNGKLWLAGHYEECLGSQLASYGKQGDTMIQMRYCWANMDIKRHLHPQLKERKRFKHETATPVLNVAVCLPRSCHSKHFHDAKTRTIVQRFIDSQLRLPDSIYLDESLQLESVFCLVDDDSDHGRLSTSGKLCLMFFSVWISLCIIATVANRCFEFAEPRKTTTGESKKTVNYMIPMSRLLRVCQNLDLVKSWQDLFVNKQRPAGDSKAAVAVVDLDVLNPIKIASCAFCVISHTGILLGSMSADFGQTVTIIDTGRLLMGALLSSTVIDGFFTMSGILVTYTSLRKLSKSSSRRQTIGSGKSVYRVELLSPSLDHHHHDNHNHMAPTSIESTVAPPHSPSNNRRLTQFMHNWLDLTLNRYLRIVPLYALLFWFRRDVLQYLGSGPMWDHGLNHNTPSGACSREPWYTPFTFISALNPVLTQCIPTTWSVSNDLAYALFTPPIILILSSRPKLAIFGSCVLILASTLASMEALISSNPALVWEFLEYNLSGLMIQAKDLSPIYAWPIYRISSFLVGTLAGYCLFKHESTHAPKWPQWFSGPLTLLSCFYFIAHTILAATSNDLKAAVWPLMRLFVFFNFNLDRVVWSMASAVLFLQMMTSWRHNSLMQNFSSHPWRIMAKLCYSVVFIHWILMIVYTGTMSAPPPFTLSNIFAATSLVFPTSFVIGALLYVLFENPIDKLIKRELLVHLNK